MKTNLLRLLCFCLFTGLVLSSCKKTETIELPQQSTSKITSYTVTNILGDPIIGSINQDKKTITVYLPYTNYLTSLVPEIKVSEGAKVNPVNGTIVENLMDVFDKGREIKYTVTAADGSTSVYALTIIVQQPSFTLTELSPGVANAVEFTNPTLDNGSLTIAWTGPLPTLNRDLDFELLKITFTDLAGKEFVVSNNSRTGYPIGVIGAGVMVYFNSFTEKLPSGTYYIKVRFYSKTVAMQFPIKFVNLKV